MEKQSKDERERMNKLNEMLLYNIGYEHADNICEETDVTDKIKSTDSAK